MKYLLALIAIFMFVTVPMEPALFAQGIDFGDDEEDGMTDEEFREFIYELIEQIIEEYKSEGPNIDNESNPQIVDFILRKLELQKVTVHFQETSFYDCLEFLRDITGLNIVISARARDIIDSENIMVNLRLREIKLKSVLALMLEASEELTYGVKYDVLYIGTKDDWAGVGQFMMIYSIHELVYRPPDFPAPEIGLGDLIPWQNK